MENQCGAELISRSDTVTVVFHCVRCYTGEINIYVYMLFNDATDEHCDTFVPHIHLFYNGSS